MRNHLSATVCMHYKCTNFTKAFELFNFLPMNQTPMTTPPSRQSTHRAANTLTSLLADTLQDTLKNNSSCSTNIYKKKVKKEKIWYLERINNNKV